MKKALGVDIGGTKISACLVSSEGEIVSDIKKWDTPKTADGIYSLLKNEVVTSFEHDLLAIATAGAVNKENTQVLGSTANLPQGYSDLDFVNLEKDKFVFVENDANAAAWAEYKLGVAKGQLNTVIVTLGTGVGGGIVVDGTLLRGKSGMGGEIGHIKISNEKRLCTCGEYDCFEAFASGTGLKKTAEIFTGDKTISTYDVIDKSNKGDKLARKIMDTWHEHIFRGLLSLTNVFDPESIVISGGMAAFVDMKYIEEKINCASVVSDTKVLKASFENNAGMVGAALLAFKYWQ